VDDPAIVACGEPSRDLARVFNRLARRQRTLRATLAERVAIEQLHDERAVLGPVGLRNVGMAEPGRRLRFALEARQPIGIRRVRPGKELQRDVAAELRVSRSIDFTLIPRRPRGATIS
jgi:hypothetical protein